MKESVLLIGIHCHQPEGNFHHVIAEAYEACYRPLLEVLSRHPSVKVSLHYSGTLLEWLEKNHPEYLGKIKDMLDAGRAEILGGGMYEPILPSLPVEDARDQIEVFSRRLKERFSRVPRGIWLAERVWSPSLASLLTRSGVEFTILDDTHFLASGIRDSALHGYFLTEGEGRPLALFPIKKALRYSIPFSPAGAVLDLLRRDYEENGPRALTYADDGEKFGAWPGTHRSVYDEGWLEAFLTGVEKNSRWLRTMTFSEYLDGFPPAGRVYIPTASYDEMMSWSLPYDVRQAFEAFLDDLDRLGLGERARGFLRGGWWENFLARYPEANLLHKKMLSVGRKLRAAAEKYGIPDRVWTEYRKAQANDVYWHGLFGGLYFHFLRREAYVHLIRCEKELDLRANGEGPWVRMVREDLDADRQEETVLTSPFLHAVIDPSEGGCVLELDWRVKPLNLTNVLSRRPESYHDDLARLTAGGAGDPPQSIHHIRRVKEQGLDRVLVYDRHTRWSFLDHVLSPDTSLDTWINCRYKERGDFLHGAYDVIAETKEKENLYTMKLRRRGSIEESGKTLPLEIEKAFVLSGTEPSLEVRYTVRGPEPIRDLWFGVEMNLGLLIGLDPQRYLIIGEEREPSRQGRRDGVTMTKIVDETEGVSLSLALDPPGSLWWFPIETVSSSEGGIERSPQGTAFLAHWRPGERVFGPSLTLMAVPR